METRAIVKITTKKPSLLNRLFRNPKLRLILRDSNKFIPYTVNGFDKPGVGGRFP